MIFMLIVALVIGVLGGAAADELLRGRDPRSQRVVIAGAIGAFAGLLVRRVAGAPVGGGDMVVSALMTFLGAALLAFVTRVRLSAAIARRVP